jgi:hypothetical protein
MTCSPRGKVVGRNEAGRDLRYAPTLDEAKAKFRQAWEKAKRAAG